MDKFAKAIEKTAKQNHRSVNGEIERAIEYYLKNAPEAHYDATSQPADQVVEVKDKSK
jgi:hypothetical protein